MPHKTFWNSSQFLINIENCFAVLTSQLFFCVSAVWLNSVINQNWDPKYMANKSKAFSGNRPLSATQPYRLMYLTNRDCL